MSYLDFCELINELNELGFNFSFGGNTKRVKIWINDNGILDKKPDLNFDFRIIKSITDNNENEEERLICYLKIFYTCYLSEMENSLITREYFTKKESDILQKLISNEK
jgi:hypothetical protein